MKVQLLYSRKVLPGKLAMGGRCIIWPGNETMTISIFGDNRIVYNQSRPHGTRWRKSQLSVVSLNSCIHPMVDLTYVTGFAKRDHIPQILILSYKRF